MSDDGAHRVTRMLRRVWKWLSPDTWQHTIARIAAVALVVALGGFAFITLGLTPIAAEDGHWKLTERFLRYTMTQSVRVQSLGTVVPPLDDPGLVLKGAGHYATDCAPCHGAPGQAAALAVEQMVPNPPNLLTVVSDWKPHQLHWIIKHGIKYTAMPAWPAQHRDDEVWAMVAFLRRLPDMEEQEYRRLAYGPLADTLSGAGENQLGTLRAPRLSLLDNCARCHGAEGEGRGDGAVPRLAGQREDYLRTTLEAFADGRRHSGIMQSIAAALEPAQISALARHYASASIAADPSKARRRGYDQSVTPADSSDVAAQNSSPSTRDALAKGESLARDGVGNRRIPACRHCHGPGDADIDPEYPRLAGQHSKYLVTQLRLFQEGRRGGADHHHLMKRAAAGLSSQDVSALAAYYGSLRDDGESSER